MSATKVRLLAISGSLRRSSYNTAILRTLAERVPNDVEILIHPLDQVPLYNQDLDGDNPPAAVIDLKAAIADADGIIVASSEFNYGIPGVLKNALDWASRPAMKSPLKGKPTLLITSSPGLGGGVRAHAPLRETLSGCLARVVARPQVTIALVHQKIVEGELIDEGGLQFCLEAVDDLIREIQLLLKRTEDTR